VSLSEIIDAARSTTQIDISRRPELHAALRATLIKQARHYPTFEWAFDRYFPARLVRSEVDPAAPASDSPLDLAAIWQRSPPPSSTSTPGSTATSAPRSTTCSASFSAPTSPA
jgi:uncharacterized protein with von Willebrand factor type A (vWA) domain